MTCRRTALSLLLCAAACTDVQLGLPPAAPLAALDNGLTVQGTYCTEPAGTAVFPVKIIFLVDLSNSMCYSDPASGVCSPLRCDAGPQAGTSSFNPPRRAQAVQEVINRYTNNPAVSYSIITFSSQIHAHPFDDTNGAQTFTRDTSLLKLEELRNIDSVTDYQGALSRAKTLLSQDMATVALRRKSELPRTKYAVIFLTDGTPFPHCSRADPTHNQPPDSPSCGSDPSTCTICQNGGTSTLFPDLQKGNDYNEPYQLAQLVDEMHRLADSYAVGDLKFHAAQLKVDNAAVCCPLCFGDDPDGSRAAALLTAMAQPDKGLGTYVRFRTPQDLTFVDYDFTSLQQQFVTRQLIAYNANEVATPTGPALDSDGDGIPDEVEYQLGTDPLNKYSDNDGYSDLFKERFKDRGFKHGVSQIERCRANSPKCPLVNGKRSTCDTDGDGLNDCEEFEIGTDPELVDTDGDGIPDGVEFRVGMDPLRDDTREDLDFDGIRNLDEVLQFSSPTLADTRASQAFTIQTTTTQTSVDPVTKSVCYSFQVQGIKLLSPLSRAPAGLPIGWSDTLLWLGEAPAGDNRDYGRFRLACVRTRWVPPDVRLPLEPSVTLVDADFKDPAQFRADRDCKGAKP